MILREVPDLVLGLVGGELHRQAPPVVHDEERYCMNAAKNSQIQGSGIPLLLEVDPATMCKRAVHLALASWNVMTIRNAPKHKTKVLTETR